MAQRVSDFMDVGDKLWLRGRIKHRQYTDDDGVVRSISEIHARELKMIWTKNKPKSIMVDDADFDDLEAEFLAQENQTVSMMIEEKLN